MTDWNLPVPRTLLYSKNGKNQKVLNIFAFNERWHGDHDVFIYHIIFLVLFSLSHNFPISNFKL